MEDKGEFLKVTITKKPLSCAERKANQRKREKEKKEGTFPINFLDQAKEEITQTMNYDLAALLDKEQFKDKFDEAQIKQLKKYIVNSKYRSKKTTQEVKQNEQQQLNVKEKAQRLGNHSIPQLHQSLLTPQTQEERIQQIKSKIDENLYLFLEYMQNYQSPTPDFLSIILDLYDNFDSDTSTKLFVRVCAMYRGENLIINKSMVQSAMKFLIDNKVDNIASYGLLRLVFQNDISFIDFDISLLQQFQAQYEQTILNFFKSIPGLQYSIIESLPSTSFCFTNPILKALKDGGDILHRQIPYQFLPYLVEIICYSFNDEQESFDHLLNVFKNGCRKLYEILLTSDFPNLLQSILDKTKNMNQQFFMSLKLIIQIFERAFELLSDKKIDRFDEEIIQSLLESNNEAYQVIKNRPSCIKQKGKSIIQQIINSLLKNNKEIKQNNLYENDSLSEEQTTFFRDMNIVNLLPIQELCFKYCTLNDLNGINLFMYDTGQGKTSLCLGLAIHFLSSMKKIFIVNYSSDLSFRDFKKSKSLRTLNKLNSCFINEDNYEMVKQSQLVYIIYSHFISICNKLDDEQLSQSICLIDEYDQLLLQESLDVETITKILFKFKCVYGFSGSKLQQYQKEFLQRNIKAQIYDFTLNQSMRIIPQCVSTEVFSTMKSYKDSIINICKHQVRLSPIILIIIDNYLQVQNILRKNGLRVDCLHDKNLQQVDSSIQVFREKADGMFAIYMINEKQGRGIDFISSQEIEDNGGVCVIIASLPQNYSQFQQFIGRTGRVGLKGQYSVVLFDKEAKNENGQVYLNKKLLELQNNDLLMISQLQNRNHQNENEQESKLDQLEQKNNQKIKSCSFEEIKQENHQLLPLNIDVEINEQKIEKSNQNIDEEEMIKPSNSKLYYLNNSKQQVNIDKKRVRKLQNKVQRRESKRLKEKNSNDYEIDELYFQNYSNPEIHQEMLGDKVRMETYQRAIEKVCKNKIVIDVGAGTGILSLFAAKGGARQVYAIEFSSIANDAKKNIKENGMEKIITVVQEKAEEVILPLDKVDLIISEWMGYFLLFEKMLPSVVHIRKNFLKEDGIIIPSNAALFISAFEHLSQFQGFNLNSIGTNQISKARIEECSSDGVISESSKIFDIDLKIEDFEMNQFESDFSLVIIRDGTLNGFIGWFDTQLWEDIVLSTSPFSSQTHWKQTFFPLESPIIVKKEDKIIGKIKVSQKKDNHRALCIIISYKKEFEAKEIKQKFTLE